jgi:hypothetical protein
LTARIYAFGMIGQQHADADAAVSEEAMVTGRSRTRTGD